MTLGNETDALTALTLTSDSPEYIGEGAYRTAYLINGIVYKVQHDDDGNNADEWANYLSLIGTLPAPLAIPEMYLWNLPGHDIIAAEYINGDPFRGPQTYRIIKLAQAATQLFDLMGTNIIVRAGTYYLVDIAQ